MATVFPWYAVDTCLYVCVPCWLVRPQCYMPPGMHPLHALHTTKSITGACGHLNHAIARYALLHCIINGSSGSFRQLPAPHQMPQDLSSFPAASHAWSQRTRIPDILTKGAFSKRPGPPIKLFGTHWECTPLKAES